MERHTYRVELAYDGAGFAGFERQVGVRTVESELVAALKRLVPDLPKVAAGGRTDRGVSASGQVISFWSRGPLEPEAVAGAIDRAAPGEICALSVREVPRSFHATFSASARRYLYAIAADVDARKIDRMLAGLLGRRSFYAFARDTPRGKDCVRTLHEARVRASTAGLVFEFCADGFLRHQIRVLVATALREIDGGGDALVRIAESEDRTRTAPPLGPEGLTLSKVIYAPTQRSRSKIPLSSADMGCSGSSESARS